MADAEFAACCCEAFGGREENAEASGANEASVLEVDDNLFEVFDLFDGFGFDFGGGAGIEFAVEVHDEDIVVCAN